MKIIAIFFLFTLIISSACSNKEPEKIDDENTEIVNNEQFKGQSEFDSKILENI